MAYPFRISMQLQYYVKREKCKVNDVIFPSGCQARAINLGNKNVKIGIFTGGTSIRSKNIFTDISQYPTGKHDSRTTIEIGDTTLKTWARVFTFHFMHVNKLVQNPTNLILFDALLPCNPELQQTAQKRHLETFWGKEKVLVTSILLLFPRCFLKLAVSRVVKTLDCKVTSCTVRG